MRRDLMKGYILALLADGQVRLTDSPAAAVARVLSCAREDAVLAVGEILREGAAGTVERGAERIGGLLGEKLMGVARVIREPGGIAAVWKDMQAGYWRGASEHARRRK